MTMTRNACLFGTALLMVPVAILSAGQASGAASVPAADPAWQVQVTPNPAKSTADELLDVSCVTTADCTAVGGFNTSAISESPLIEHWNGSEWTIAVDGSVGGIALLTGVSCSSATFCVAVGYGAAATAHVESALIEVWNGGTWTLVAGPTVSRTVGVELNSISCASSRACTAVGAYIGKHEHTLAFFWNGSVWRRSDVPQPELGRSAYLGSVSCSSAASCTAVGVQKISASGAEPLIEVRRGGSWAIVDTPAVLTGDLRSVSCTSPTTCTAAGTVVKSGSEDDSTIPFIAVETNGAWQEAPVPAPNTSFSSYFSGISCTTATMCTAVGGKSFTNDTVVPLIEVEQGSSWRIVASPAPDRESLLAGVACVTATACTAVGQAALDTLAVANS
jgi:hypothetical protein